MFDKALVALDLSPAERPIIGCLPELRQWGVRHLVLTHVIQYGYAQGAGLAHQEDYESWLEEVAAPLRDAGFSVTVMVRASGAPDDEILAAAREAHADLLVIGSRGQNILRKLFLGSVAREVIRKSPLPLLLEWIEPSEEATQKHCEAVCGETLRHILFATDFSPHGDAAEKALLALAPAASKVECVHVLPCPEKSAEGLSQVAARDALTAVTGRITATGAESTAELLHGKASVEIARYAREHNVSLIVVGKHGQHWVSGKVIGSTAANLCEIAGRPVLMVP
jgi:nucleotide-binding universal stress UspA family protein